VGPKIRIQACKLRRRERESEGTPCHADHSQTNALLFSSRAQKLQEGDQEDQDTVPELLNGKTSGSERGLRDHRTCTQMMKAERQTASGGEAGTRLSWATDGPGAIQKHAHAPSKAPHSQKPAQLSPSPVPLLLLPHTHFLGSQRRGSATSRVLSYCRSASLI
jgi:hypothetical protein